MCAFHLYLKKKVLFIYTLSNFNIFHKTSFFGRALLLQKKMEMSSILKSLQFWLKFSVKTRMEKKATYFLSVEFSLEVD